MGSNHTLRPGEGGTVTRAAPCRAHLYVTCYTEGFSHFVTSMTAPVASGWSGCRVGLAPTGKRRLLTAHTSSGHCGSLPRTSRLEKHPSAKRDSAGYGAAKPRDLYQGS